MTMEVMPALPRSWREAFEPPELVLAVSGMVDDIRENEEMRVRI